jgi:hypothetical protein
MARAVLARGLDYRPESDVRPSKKKASTAASSRNQPGLIFTALLLPIQYVQSSLPRLPLGPLEPIAARTACGERTNNVIEFRSNRP